MTYLREPDAWREIAERIHRRGLPLGLGLCYEVSIAAEPCTLEPCTLEPCIIDAATRVKMGERLYYHGKFRWEPGTFTFAEAAQVRILAALVLALDAEDHP